jgi:hypothetical protein
MSNSIASTFRESSSPPAEAAHTPKPDASLKRKPVPNTKAALNARLADADASLKDLGKAWQSYHYDKADGHDPASPMQGDAFKTHKAAVAAASAATKALAPDRSLRGNAKAAAIRVGLGVRGLAKATLFLGAGAVMLATVVGTLGIANSSDRVNARAKYALVHGCLHGAKADIARMVLTDAAGLREKYNHQARGNEQRALLRGGHGPVFSGTRSRS